MTRCWLRSRWQGNLRKAGARAIRGRETKVPGTQTRPAKVTHLGDRRRTPVNSNSNSNNSSNNSSNNLDSNNSSNNLSNNSNPNNISISSSISRSTSSSKR